MVLLLLTFSLLQKSVVISKGRDWMRKPRDCLEVQEDQLDIMVPSCILCI